LNGYEAIFLGMSLAMAVMWVAVMISYLDKKHPKGPCQRPADRAAVPDDRTGCATTTDGGGLPPPPECAGDAATPGVAPTTELRAIAATQPAA
jgi:hypothetical protein